MHVYARETVAAEQRTSLSVIAAYVMAGARVLDLGTGAGGLGAHLSAHKGCVVDGLTLNEAEAEAGLAGAAAFTWPPTEDTDSFADWMVILSDLTFT